MRIFGEKSLISENKIFTYFFDKKILFHPIDITFCIIFFLTVLSKIILLHCKKDKNDHKIVM